MHFQSKIYLKYFKEKKNTDLDGISNRSLRMQCGQALVSLTSNVVSAENVSN